jgi:hypothetical protein
LQAYGPEKNFPQIAENSIFDVFQLHRIVVAKPEKCFKNNAFLSLQLVIKSPSF